MLKPTNQDPAAWAEYNQWRSAMCNMFVGNLYAELALTQSATGIDVRSLPTPVLNLVIAVRRAATDLELGGERENRIANQLWSALADIAKETGT